MVDLSQLPADMISHFGCLGYCDPLPVSARGFRTSDAISLDGHKAAGEKHSKVSRSWI